MDLTNDDKLHTSTECIHESVQSLEEKPGGPEVEHTSAVHGPLNSGLSLNSINGGLKMKSLGSASSYCKNSPLSLNSHQDENQKNLNV